MIRRKFYISAIWLISLCAPIFIGCSESGQRYGSGNRRVAPSESMQAGVSRNSSYGFMRRFFGLHPKNNLTHGNYTGQYKVGNPYKIGDVTYYPKNYDTYEETGIASWYGDDFHAKRTANGEIYDKGDLTAAHPTLPMPSIAEVINLDNGKTVKVRINDRGPFAKNRIVDMSEASAAALGFRDNGTTAVKIRFLKKETDELLSSLGIGPSR